MEDSVLEHAAHALRRRLVSPVRIEGTDRIGPRAFALIIDGGGRRSRLVLDVDPNHPTLHFEPTPRREEWRGGFGQRLRGSFVVDARMALGDRRIEIDIALRTVEPSYRLHIAWHGRGGNLWLVDLAAGGSGIVVERLVETGLSPEDAWTAPAPDPRPRLGTAGGRETPPAASTGKTGQPVSPGGTSQAASPGKTGQPVSDGAGEAPTRAETEPGPIPNPEGVGLLTAALAESDPPAWLRTLPRQVAGLSRPALWQAFADLADEAPRPPAFADPAPEPPADEAPRPLAVANPVSKPHAFGDPAPKPLADALHPEPEEVPPSGAANADGKSLPTGPTGYEGFATKLVVALLEVPASRRGSSHSYRLPRMTLLTLKSPLYRAATTQTAAEWGLPEAWVSISEQPAFRDFEVDGADSAADPREDGGRLFWLLARTHRDLLRAEAGSKRAASYASRIATEERRIARIGERLRQELSDEEGPLLRSYGEAILSHLHLVERGAALLVCPDLRDPGGPDLRVPLDPARPATETAESYFRSARRWEKGRSMRETRLGHVERALAGLGSMAEVFRRAESPPPHDEVEAHLREITGPFYRGPQPDPAAGVTGGGKTRGAGAEDRPDPSGRAKPRERGAGGHGGGGARGGRGAGGGGSTGRGGGAGGGSGGGGSGAGGGSGGGGGGAGGGSGGGGSGAGGGSGTGSGERGASGVTKLRHTKRDPDSRFRPRVYHTSEGWTVVVGRSNQENDYVTMKVAKQDDYWFHAHGVPGSHVVLKRDGRKDNPSRKTLEEAAAIAAFYSKARNSGRAAVIYTLKKYVTKPRKAKAGLVTCTRETSIMVRPMNPEPDTPPEWED